MTNRVKIRFKEQVGSAAKGDVREIDSIMAADLIKRGRAELYGQQPRTPGKKTDDPKLKDFVEEAEKRFNELTEAHESEINEIKEAHAAEIEKLKEEHAAEIEKVKSETVAPEVSGAETSEGAKPEEVTDGPKSEDAGNPDKKEEKANDLKTK